MKYYAEQFGNKPDNYRVACDTGTIILTEHEGGREECEHIALLMSKAYEAGISSAENTFLPVIKVLCQYLQ